MGCGEGPRWLEHVVSTRCGSGGTVACGPRRLLSLCEPTDAEMNTRILRLGFAARAAGVVFYITESFYLRREEKLDKRQSRPEDT